MADLNDTPRGTRVHIAFFGLRNAGKSTLVNAFTGQPIAIVSDVPGTTTDPVSKAMEILPLGPCLITDTAGLDDVGALGQMRVEKTLKVLETTDVAVWVSDGMQGMADSAPCQAFRRACAALKVTVLEFRRGDSIEGLKRKVAAVKMEDEPPALLEGLVGRGDRVLCVVPIDESAPKGRLILPEQQVIRDCLDRGAPVTVCQPEALSDGTVDLAPFRLVVADSQAFGEVRQAFLSFRRSRPSVSAEPRLTSFSILFARQKGDLGEYVKGLAALSSLKDGDTVLIAEGCTHHRQCNDIGTVKLPKAVCKLTGKDLSFAFAAGGAFWEEGARTTFARPALVIHCGGCMLTRREVLRRIGVARAAGIPIVNYGMVLAAANGLKVEDVLA